jgi:hypothetical protein
MKLTAREAVTGCLIVMLGLVLALLVQNVSHAGVHGTPVPLSHSAQRTYAQLEAQWAAQGAGTP